MSGIMWAVIIATATVVALLVPYLVQEIEKGKPSAVRGRRWVRAIRAPAQ